MSELLWTAIPYTDIPVVVVAALVGLWFLLRNRATTFASGSELDGMLQGGQPLVLEFFSNT